MTIEVRYNDGSFESIALRKGEQIHDWWNQKDTDVSVIAWQGSNPVKNNLGLGLFEWENPQPAKVVDRFVLGESGNDSTPFIAAITLTGQKPQFAQLRGRGAPVEETILLIEGKSKTTSTGLAKLKIPFDLADASNWHQENIDKYDILIFGDWAMADYKSADVVKKIKDFVKDGGSLLSFDRGLGYAWKGTPLSHNRTKHYIVDSIIDKDHLIFNRPNPITLGDLENIARGQIYAALRNLAKGWQPLVKGVYLHMK